MCKQKKDFESFNLLKMKKEFNYKACLSVDKNTLIAKRLEYLKDAALRNILLFDTFDCYF